MVNGLVEQIIPLVLFSFPIFREHLFINFCSISNKAVAMKKGFIRGQSILSGYFVQKRGDGCSVTYVSQVDLKGTLKTLKQFILCLDKLIQ